MAVILLRCSCWDDVDIVMMIFVSKCYGGRTKQFVLGNFVWKLGTQERARSKLNLSAVRRGVGWNRK